MLFISSIDYITGRYGITDTDDWVEEFFTRDKLREAFDQMGNVIKGLTYTGSDFKIRTTTPACERIGGMRLGQPFVLEGLSYVYAGECSDGRGWHVYDMRTKTHTKLLTERVKKMGVRARVTSEYDRELFASFKEWLKQQNPTTYGRFYENDKIMVGGKVQNVVYK